MLKNKQNAPTKPEWSLDERDPVVIQSLLPLWEWLYDNYFRVETSGWNHILPDETVLFVGTHNGGFAAPDMLMMIYDWFRRYGVERPIYALTDSKVWQGFPPLAQLASKIGAITAHPKMAITALRSGASLLLYPGGAQDIFRPHSQRHQIYFSGRKAFIKLALREQVPIVPLISVGAHDTLIVLTDCYKILQQLKSLGINWPFGIDLEVFPIYLGLPWGLAIGPLPNIPLPVKIHTRICPKIVFERYGSEAASDRSYVNACYELVINKMQQELDCLVKSSQAS
ncbi:MAG: acyltransferase family protein [Scytonematopsis contorta HA4267-MV1]|jgi:1-acyl-sn-glycerol-3-phosphate acyltransferase|nr:acyltransferase family protein [Scytonematopsis contorta HA4267-MV1]